MNLANALLLSLAGGAVTALTIAFIGAKIWERRQEMAFNEAIARAREAAEIKAGKKALASIDRANALEIARDIAKKVALGRADHTATADDVYNTSEFEGLSQYLGNAAGSIFLQKENWYFWGEQRSTRKSNHGRYIKVWKYIGPGSAGVSTSGNVVKTVSAT